MGSLQSSSLSQSVHSIVVTAQFSLVMPFANEVEIQWENERYKRTLQRSCCCSNDDQKPPKKGVKDKAEHIGGATFDPSTLHDLFHAKMSSTKTEIKTFLMLPLLWLMNSVGLDKNSSLVHKLTEGFCLDIKGVCWQIPQCSSSCWIELFD